MRRTMYQNTLFFQSGSEGTIPLSKDETGQGECEYMLGGIIRIDQVAIHVVVGGGAPKRTEVNTGRLLQITSITMHMDISQKINHYRLAFRAGQEATAQARALAQLTERKGRRDPKRSRSRGSGT